MSYCPNPDCSKPKNPDKVNFCQTCGTKLLLRERYRPIAPLGSGGFGKTFLAIDQDRFNSPCVIKQFSPPPSVQQDPQLLKTAIRLFNHEAEQLHKLGSHDRIPELFAHFDQNLDAQIHPAGKGRDRYLYLVQAFIDGQTLQQELEQRGTFSEKEILAVLLDLLPILQFIHAQGVIHRDLKPANILRRKSDRRLVLIDFGAAKAVATGTTLMRQPGTHIGSAGYAAPEQTLGRARFASDLYSLGVTCLELVTQSHPFDLWSPAEDAWIWRQALPQPKAISDPIAQILDKLVERPLKRRYQSATDVIQDLRTLLGQPQGKAPPRPLAAPPASLPKSNAPRTMPQMVVPLPEPIAPPASLPLTPQPIQIQPFTFEFVQIQVQGKPRRQMTLVRQSGKTEFFQETLLEAVSLDMIAIPRGRFLMGSPRSEEGSTPAEHPQHTVEIAPFFLGRYPVTQAQYQAVMGRNPSHFPGDDQPVESVSWQDAVQFCDRLTQATGRWYRLPSEAEWEYACRAGTTTPFSYGETLAPELANYRWSAAYGQGSTRWPPSGRTSVVGSFPANGFGLQDMHGNVWEWCQDTWHDHYKVAPTQGTPWVSADDPYHVRRGGAWNSNPWNCRSAAREKSVEGDSDKDTGFRVLCTM